jgi:two-component system LytT family response regulator
MMPWRALLVDDERLARVQLRNQLEHFPEFQIVAEADSVAGAVGAVRRFEPDLVFLDVQMPGTTGFEFLQRAPNTFQVIFVTAFDEFALRAFEVNALDYLLKPVQRERLAAALERVSQEKVAREPVRAPLQYSDSLFVVDRGTARFVKVRAIRCIVAAKLFRDPRRRRPQVAVAAAHQGLGGASAVIAIRSDASLAHHQSGVRGKS